MYTLQIHYDLKWRNLPYFEKILALEIFMPIFYDFFFQSSKIKEWVVR